MGKFKSWHLVLTVVPDALDSTSWTPLSVSTTSLLRLCTGPMICINNSP